MTAITRTILVTGGAGFIGGNFVRRMVLGGRARVVTLDKLTYAGNRATLADLDGRDDHVFVEGDIADGEVVAGLLDRYQPQAIVNFAAESHVDRSIDESRAFIDTNIVGVQVMLEAARAFRDGLPGAARDAFKFLQVSTDEVFGDLAPDDPPFDPTTPYAPSSPYAASKAAADHLVRAWVRTYGLPAMITNCSNNYGPFQFPEKLIPLAILKALDGAAIPLYGDGAQVRDWLYVDDHCAALELVLNDGAVGETYLIGGRAEHPNRILLERLCAVLDNLLADSPHRPHAALITPVPDRPGHDRRYAIDPRKVERDLGWRAAESLDSGLEKTVRWYLDNQAWWRAIQQRAYRGERLGLADGKA